eukprot:Skav210168  [mRNA]  locus=scaffold483:43403:52814:- [translate_table: standard]
MAAKQRLQELFARQGQPNIWYDTNGDGTLTEEEVTPLFVRFGENVAFPEGSPAVFTVGPSQEMEDKVIMTVEKVPFSYALPNWTARSAFTGVEDDVSNAFVPGLGDPSEAVLFDQVRPQDIDQGGLGDCWLMAALACLAEYPTKLKSLFESKHITEDGKYKVFLFDVEKMEWSPVIVDEFVPCKIRKNEPVPCFAEPLGDELWVLLLEKAVAKWCGSYGMLSGALGTPTAGSITKGISFSWRPTSPMCFRCDKQG